MLVYTYNRGLYGIMAGNIDFDSSDIRVALLGSGYVFSRAHNTFSEVQAQEISGTGYTAGGAQLTGLTVSEDDTNNRVVFDAADVVFANSTLTARYAVIYVYNADTAQAPLIACLDFEQNESSNSGNFTIQWNTDGIFRLSQSA